MYSTEKNKLNFEDRNHIIEYYQAFELLLANQRSLQEFRTQFGIMNNEILIDDYCFFKAAFLPEQHPKMSEAMVKSCDELHQALFHSQPRSTIPKNILDVGCGAGGSMYRLSLDWPCSQINGINLNPIQLEVAHSKFNDISKLNFIYGDFLTHPLKENFDLMYFIESAFHIHDKTLMMQRIANHLSQGGEVYFVDILFSDAMKRFSSKKSVNEEIFHYMPLEDWRTLGEQHGLTLETFEDFSQETANHIRSTMPESEFEEIIIKPLIDGVSDNNAVMIERSWEGYYGYKRLYHLLTKGLMHYGILRFKKAC